jgi:hypothetical protein
LKSKVFRGKEGSFWMSSATELGLTENFERLEAEEYTIPLSSSVALEIYANTKPKNLKIAKLQKGLIIVCNGVEKVGEGTGFGFPVLIYPKETFFSSSAEVHLARTSDCVKIRKDFIMDMTARNKIRNVRLENRQARGFIRVLTDLYQVNKRFRFLRLKEFIVNMGVNSIFLRTSPIGRIPVTYTIHDSVVKVEVDLRHLKKCPKKIFILNEQSASFFRKYSDSQGATLLDGQIGAWDTIDAEWASLTDLQGRIGYRLWNFNTSILRRGRETMRNCLDWAGLDYEVNPRCEAFEYRIEIVGAKP